MKKKLKSQKIISLFFILLLLFTYSNCSEFKSTHQGLKSSTATSLPAFHTPSTEENVTADKNGHIVMLQDLSMIFAIPQTTPGAVYQIANQPTWLTLDNSKGQLKGVPPSPGLFPNIMITVLPPGKSAITLGPYQIEVIGNPLKDQQWHLKNTGQKSFAGLSGKIGEDIHLDETIKNHFLGSHITIAVSDTGVQESHPGLSSGILSSASRNYLTPYSSTKSWLGNSSPQTSSGDFAHGTAVAGLIGERGWTGYGGRGVAPLSQLVGFLFLQAQDQLLSDGLLSTAILDQFSGDFDIYNFSWIDPQCALNEYDSSYAQKLQFGAQNYRGEKGALYVKAAGNSYQDKISDCYSSSSSTYYYGNANFSEESVEPYTIVVGAVNADGLSSSYSSPGANIWVSAPGGEFGFDRSSINQQSLLKPALITTDFIGCSLGIKSFHRSLNDFDNGVAPNTDCSHTATMNGTSGATPLVSGALALLLSANNQLTWRDVKHILASTSDKIDANRTPSSHPDSSLNLTGHIYEQGWITNAAGFHFHNWYGFGRINVDQAVAMAQNYNSYLGTLKTTNTGTTWKYDSGDVNITVPGGSTQSLNMNISDSLTVEAVQVHVSARNCIGNLGIELTSPSGTKSILMNINSLLMDTSMSHTFLSNAFYGENSSGLWTLKLIGGKSGCSTVWESWKLNLFGH